MIAAAQPRKILDLATGSGDLAISISRVCPNARVVGTDFCRPMLDLALGKDLPSLVQGDGTRLPFRDDSFDALTVSFGLRNMASWSGALHEMARVLRPGGMLLIMDFSLPELAPLRWIYRLYLHHVLPLFAAAITGDKAAYEYLGQSIEQFPRNEKMLSLMKTCGFEDTRMHPLCFGVAAIYTARRRAAL